MVARNIERKQKHTWQSVADWWGWGLAGMAFIIHAALAMRDVRAGIQLPTLRQIAQAGYVAWLDTYGKLFAHPEYWPDAARVYAFWGLVFFALSIRAAHRTGEEVLYGVLLFLSYILSSAVALAVMLPVTWILLGEWGAVASRFVPPVLLTGFALLLERNTWLKVR